jgi:hypothetical protein
LRGLPEFPGLAKPATSLLRKDWLFSWIGAVVSLFGANERARVQPCRHLLSRGGALVVAADDVAKPKEIPMTDPNPSVEPYPTPRPRKQQPATAQPCSTARRRMPVPRRRRRRQALFIIVYSASGKDRTRRFPGPPAHPFAGSLGRDADGGWRSEAD